jgi:predicted metal-binding membrane protein
MSGGWTMTMVWSRMPGQTWTGASAAFLAMWVAMMIVMMVPSLTPVLWRYGQLIARAAETRRPAARRVSLTALAGAGYFAVWAALGAAVYPVGAALSALVMLEPTLARAVPAASGAVVLLAGLYQFTTWKARHLECCRVAGTSGPASPPDVRSAWRFGLRLGLHCSCCSAGQTLILLVAGVMDLRVMTAVTAAITLERLVPDADRAARAIGAALIAIGAALMIASGWGR